MPVETLIVIAAVIATFGLFGLVLAYVNAIAGDRAITAEEEQAARRRAAAPANANAAPLKLAA